MISFDEFLKQDECDKYNMLQECNAIIQQKENIIKEVREYITYWHYRNDFRINSFTTGVKEELLGILDKEVN